MPAPIRVLCVDDDPDFASLTATFLEREREDFAVETATGARNGLDRVAERSPDCVVSDYQMPGMDGLAFLEAVREMEPDVPFILFTAKGSEEVASRAISLGVTDYLRKGSSGDRYELLANRITNAVEKVRAERQVERERDRFEVLFERLTQPVVEVVFDDRDEPIVRRVNDAFEERFGYPAETIVGESLDAYLVPDDRAEEAATINEQLSAGADLDLHEVRRRTADGERDFLLQTATYDGRSGKFGIYTDVTERKRRKQELERQGELFEIVQSMADIGAWEVAPERERLWVTEQVTEIYGLGPAWDLDLEAAIERFHADDRPTIEAALERAIVDGEPYDLELRLERDDGPRWVRVLGEPHREDDEVVRVRGTIQDVTEDRERERELERRTEELDEVATQLEAQYRHLFEEAPVMAVVTRAADGEAIVEDCNQRFAERLGYETRAVIGRELGAFYTADSADQLRSDDGYKRAVAGEFVSEERVLVDADGERVETLLRAVPRRDAENGVVGTLAMYVDVSERKRLEREKERLAEFANIVSHDLRNPLTTAAGRLELAKDDCESEHLEEADRILGRMGELVEDLLNLAQQGAAVGETERVQLHDLASQCWLTVRRPGASLEIVDETTVRADRTRLTGMLENLFRNAMEHGGDGVTVTVGELDDRRGFYVADDGPGIPPSDREQVFEYGYSTSADGTGYGLGIVTQIVAAHGWEIDVTESAAGGARFEVTNVSVA